MTATTERKPTLIYIMGDTRSGSTALNIVLGTHREIISVGELYKWAVFGGCPREGNQKEVDHIFWSSVKEQYHAQGAATPFSELVEIQDRIENYRRFPLLVSGVISSQIKGIYCAHVRKLLAAISSVSHKSFIVDSSKHIGVAHVLLRCPNVDVRVLHLVRDPRGAMWSQMKRNVEQKPKPPVQAMLKYSIKNLLCTVVHRLAPSGTVLRVRYEDLISKPRQELGRIGRFLQIAMDDLIETIEQGNPLPVQYLIDGNRIRNVEVMTVKLDDEWKTQLKRYHRMLAVLLTLPFSLAYGYVGLRQHRPRKPASH